VSAASGSGRSTQTLSGPSRTTRDPDLKLLTAVFRKLPSTSPGRWRVRRPRSVFGSASVRVPRWSGAHHDRHRRAVCGHDPADHAGQRSVHHGHPAPGLPAGRSVAGRHELPTSNERACLAWKPGAADRAAIAWRCHLRLAGPRRPTPTKNEAPEDCSTAVPCKVSPADPRTNAGGEGTNRWPKCAVWPVSGGSSRGRLLALGALDIRSGSFL
jgi:hypothetical protein